MGCGCGKKFQSPAPASTASRVAVTSQVTAARANGAPVGNVVRATGVRLGTAPLSLPVKRPKV